MRKYTTEANETITSISENLSLVKDNVKGETKDKKFIVSLKTYIFLSVLDSDHK